MSILKLGTMSMFAAAIAAGLSIPTAARAEPAIVRAVLFFSPTCPHCHHVMEKHLAPLSETYGERLHIVAIDIRTRNGNDLFRAVMSHYRIPREDWGVPALVVGDTLLVGGADIPQSFPEIVKKALARQGIPWPDIPALSRLAEDADMNGRYRLEATGISGAAAGAGQTTFGERFSRDPLGNPLAVAVLAGIIGSVVWVVRGVFRKTAPVPDWPNWSIPVLVVLGLAVAGYLSFVEVGGTRAVCGPVGDCNAVQQSPYARLFGFVPVALLGLAGYVAVAAAWLAQYYGPAALRRAAALSVWGVALIGAFFSIYLTFLEPFVIGATCLWCLTSAITITLILWAASAPAKAAWPAV